MSKVWIDNDTATAIAELHRDFSELTAALKRRFAYVDAGASPHERGQRRIDAEIADQLVKILGHLLVHATTVSESTRAHIVQELGQTLATVRALRAKNWAVVPGPWQVCQISRGSSDDTSVTHNGTGYRKWLAGGASSDGGCRMPLQTEQEREVGMCKTCQYRYGIAAFLPSEQDGSKGQQ